MISPTSNQDLIDLSNFGVVGGIDATGYPVGHKVYDAARYMKQVGEMLAAFRDTLAGNITSVASRFSKEGLAHAKADLANVTLPRFDQFNDFLAGLVKSIQKQRDSMAIKDVSSDDKTAKASYNTFTWTNLPEDPLLVKAVFDGAIEEGDRDTFDAIRLAPSWLGLLPADQIADGEFRWQHKTDPQAAKLLRDLQNSYAVLTASIDNAKTSIRREAGIEGDPLSVLEIMKERP